MKDEDKGLMSEFCSECLPPEEIVAFLLGEESDCDPGLLSEHIDQCVQCAEVKRELGCVLDHLRSAEEEPPVRDISGSVMHRIESESRRSCGTVNAFNFSWKRALKYAAELIIVAGAAILMVNWSVQPKYIADFEDQSRVRAALADGVDWLVSNQQSDGGWDVAALGGEPRYAPALNGLALLALSISDVRSAAVAQSIDRAVDYLLSQQSQEGVFGSIFDRSLYNHGIATLALLSVYRQSPDVALQEPISRALAYMRDRQSFVGGWGYEGLALSDANNSVTAWQVQSLVMAHELELSDARDDLMSALDWMAGTVDKSGIFSYGSTAQDMRTDSTNLTMMGAYCLLSASRINLPVEHSLVDRVIASVSDLARYRPDDYYAAFFYAAALGSAARADFEDDLNALKSSLLDKQRRNETDSRAWLADDRWGRAGGSLYSTSMSLMALANSAIPQAD